MMNRRKKYKYRIEDKEGRLKVERLKMFIKTDYYYHDEKIFNVIPDSDNFDMLVETILNSNQSFHIDEPNLLLPVIHIQW
jgi:hypothetical protein